MIVETVAFTRQMDRLDVSEVERGAIYDSYATDPDYGAVVRRTGGLRKGRIAKDGKGKSGGYRVFSFHAGDRHPVFLLWIIDKSRDDTLTDAQEAAFKALTATLKQECG
ncbi:type II toxin-antitoxin system RelE/ParE family toxin [uncultured Sphingomonas sp.]|uniref:type II toxin-antitoxin system RelE/ParE family toxin n=1 Tax=uncultured Sphingomonas sp. TaxID=158754 RepID=UPI0035C9D024